MLCVDSVFFFPELKGAFFPIIVSNCVFGYIVQASLDVHMYVSSGTTPEFLATKLLMPIV